MVDSGSWAPGSKPEAVQLFDIVTIFVSFASVNTASIPPVEIMLSYDVAVLLKNAPEKPIRPAIKSIMSKIVFVMYFICFTSFLTAL